MPNALFTMRTDAARFQFRALLNADMKCPPPEVGRSSCPRVHPSYVMSRNTQEFSLESFYDAERHHLMI